MSFEALAPVFATLFVVIDPIGLVPMFLVLTRSGSPRDRVRIAIRAVFTAFAILLTLGLAGEALFKLLGVSLPAFRISGGLLLFLLAVEMLFEKRTERRQQTASAVTTPSADEDGDEVSVFPLGTPLIAGPGAIASIVLLMSERKGDLAEQGLVLAVLVCVLLTTLVLFLAAGKMQRFVSPVLITVLTRVFGMILAALAVQFILTGLKDAGVLAS